MSSKSSVSHTSSSDRKTKAKELVSALIGTVIKKKSKNTSDHSDDKLSATEKEIYRIAGKKAVALLDPFTVPEQAFNTGIQHDMGGQVRSIANPETIEKHLQFYYGILRLIPSLQSDLDNMTPSRLEDIVQVITTGMSEGRSTDLASVKHKGMKYVPEKMNSMSDALDPPIPEVESKSMRGVFHPQLARFLCPRRDLEEFDLDPECGMEALADGTFPMKASKWPTGFYQDDIYDPNDNTIGLFWNHVVVRFYKHLFLGPAAVINESTTRRAARPAKNRSWGLDSVDCHIIAYTYFTLSHAQQWSQTVGDMDLEDLYWRIVEMLEDESDPWVRETLAWWNRHCSPGSGPSKPSNGKRTKEDANGAGSDNDMAAIHVRRAKIKKEAAEDPFCSEPESTVAQRAPTAKAKCPKYEAAPKKPTSRPQPRVDSDEDADLVETQPRNNAPRPSVTKAKRPEYEAAPKKPTSHPQPRVDSNEDVDPIEMVSTYDNEGTDMPKAPSTGRNHHGSAPHLSTVKPKHAKYGAAPKMVSTYDNEGTNMPKAPSRNHGSPPCPSTVKPKCAEYEAAPKMVSTYDNEDTNSVLSQCPDDTDGADELATGIPPKCRRVHLKLPQPPQAGTTQDDDDAAPPLKKAKKSTKPKPQTAPVKRNPVRGKRANGF